MRLSRWSCRLCPRHPCQDLQVQVNDQFTLPPSYHSFVASGRYDGPDAPAFVNWKIRSFTSIQMVHTHAPLPRGFLRPRRMRWRWKWKENGNEMTMKMRWQLLNRNTRGGHTKGKGEGKTPTPTHLAQNGQTLKGQGKRKEKADGRRAKRQPEEGGADRSAWHNLGESQNLPRHAKDPNLT